MRHESDDRPFDELRIPEQTPQCPSEINLTDAQRAELERRLRAHEQEPGDYSTWEQLKRRVGTRPTR